MQEFEAFQKETLGIGMAREFFLAMMYFNNAAGKLLGVQANTSSQKTHDIVASTAWDLLRIPEFKFNKTAEPYVIPYIVTKEKQLAHFADLTWYREIWLDGGRGFPVNELSLEDLPRKFVEELGRNFKRLPSNRSKDLGDDDLLGVLERLTFEIDKRFS